jgi:anti-sigma regulatory factor (Ser/Thr protein kinase)
MSKRKAGSPIPELIGVLAADRGSVTAGEVADAAGVTRQAAHYHLVRMVRDGALRRVGAGRGSRYVPDADLVLTYPLEGLEEDQVWNDVVGDVPKIRDVPSNMVAVMRYAFTEMLNNAIDHSGGTEARVKVRARDPLSFEISDDGIGAFRHVRERFALPDDLAALQQLSKGRETTAPDRHSGEGIFFASKAVDLFELDANRLRWIVDNRRADQSIGEAPEHAGTRVRCDLDPGARRSLEEVFAPFVEEGSLRFDRTVVRLALFETEAGFVSRSEAKRLGTRLERFREAVIDFTGVDDVGLAFVDELFRVWAVEHPETHLVPVNASPVVERLVRRAMTSTA